MTLLQLHYLCSVVQAEFSISRAAREIGTSQPGISQQIRMLERDLQVELLARQGNRIVGLTDAGRAVVVVARRMLGDAEAIQRIAQEKVGPEGGRLSIGTTHVQARYVLRDILSAFSKVHPDVQISVHQGSPSQIANWVAAGDVDIGLAGRTTEIAPDVVFLPTVSVGRGLLTLKGHELTKSRKPPTLAEIAAHPLLTLHPALVGGWSVLETFRKAGLKPKVVMSAEDVDVLKTYVETGLGIAIVPQVAFEPERDKRLAIRSVNDLFPATVTQIQVRRGNYLRGYAVDFIGMVDFRWNRQALEEALTGNTLE